MNESNARQEVIVKMKCHQGVLPLVSILANVGRQYYIYVVVNFLFQLIFVFPLF